MSARGLNRGSVRSKVLNKAAERATLAKKASLAQADSDE